MGITTYDVTKEKGLKPWFYISYDTSNYRSDFYRLDNSSLLFSLPRDPRISTITNVLASGGEGSIYKHPTDPDRLIKVIKFNPRAKLCDRESFIESTYEEANIFSKIHNDEVKIYIHRYDPKEVRRKIESRNRIPISNSTCSIYIDMKKIQGKSLFNKPSGSAVNFSNLPLPQKWQFIHALLSAYKPLIEQDWVHRDIKPGNIIFNKTDQGHFTLNFIDFAWAVKNGTQQTNPFGTLGYFSKNALNKNARITHSDAMYSLCMVLFETILRQESSKVFFKIIITDQASYISTRSYAIKILNDEGTYSRDFNSQLRKRKILGHYAAPHEQDLIEFIYSLGTQDSVDALFIDAKIAEAQEKIDSATQSPLTFSEEHSTSSALIHKQQIRSFFNCFK